MPGPTRHSPPRLPAADGVADRDATTESLLLTGLDFYFAGQYERAIHAWTRVLFIDKGHARARAYIDRARRVLAERQREVDELLHGGLAAFDDGDAQRARVLLTALLQRGASDDRALAVLERMDRLEAGAAPTPAETPTPAPDAGEPAAPEDPRGRGRRVNLGLLALAAVCLVAAAAIVAGWERFGTWASRQAPRTTERPAVVAEADALPLPSVSDLTLAQARTLFGRGHLHEALRVLATIDVADRRRAEADTLRAEIQQALLEAAPPPPGAVPDPPAAATRR